MAETGAAPGWRSVLGRALANPALRRVQLAYVGFNAAEYGEWIAVLVYAYGRGGTTVAALVAAIQLAPCVIAAPICASLADRYPPGRVLFAGYLALALTMAATAGVMLAGAPPVVVYGAAIMTAIPFTITRPTQATLLPGVARTPDELTAANVVSNWSEGVGVVTGPVIAGLVVGGSGPGTALAVFAVIAGCSAVVVWPIRNLVRPGRDEEAEGDGDSMLSGVTALRQDPTAAFLVGLVGLQAVVIGALDLLSVVLAFEILDIGRSGVGYLNAAFGAGGIIGGAITVILVGRRRLAPPLLAGVAVWGAAFIVLGLQSSRLGAFALLGVAGASRSLVDVSGRTLLQRACDPRALAGVFGVLEGLDMGGYAIGSLIVPLLVFAGGPRVAVVGVGLLLPVAMLLGLRRLVHIDEQATVPIVEINLLRLTPLFSPLPAPELEGIARGLTARSVSGGSAVIREGEAGDRYYVIADGTAAVSQGGLEIATLKRGDGFGEIALLRATPRTATVTARTATLDLYSLDKSDFLTAVTGHDPTHEAANVIADQRVHQSLDASRDSSRR